MNVQAIHVKIQEHAWINLLITIVHVWMASRERIVKLVSGILNCWLIERFSPHILSCHFSFSCFNHWAVSLQHGAEYSRSSFIRRTWQLLLPCISDMIKQESAGMLYKELNAEAPIYFPEQFTRVSDITSRTLLSSDLSLRPPRLKSRNGENCFAYRGSSIWNSLPSEIKSSRTVGPFKEKLKAMLAKNN